ncbi:tetratricopeptide repeat protein [Candidatus Uabimicrobium sp. HlEnr_7]|uniref:tetratricopeptide repeat protein n=1 Tax=Candidatus Uabimicrobium helgolandensis TaxID=3095367 RepID=UPI003557C168
MKAFFIATCILVTTLISAESSWYNVYNAQKQKVGYAVSTLTPNNNGYSYSEKLHILQGSQFILVESLQANIDKQYRLLNMQQQTNGKIYSYNVDNNEKILHVKHTTGKVSIPFEGDIYAAANGNEAKALGLLKKGKKATIRVAVRGKIVKYRIRTTTRGSLAYNNTKVKVYVMHVTDAANKAKMYISASGTMYKLKASGIEMKKVSEEQALNKNIFETRKQKTSKTIPYNSTNQVQDWANASPSRELDNIGRQIEYQISIGQARYLDSLADIPFLVKLTTKNLNLNAKEIRDFTAGASSSFQFGQTMVNAVAQGGQYKFLRSSANPPGLLFRLITAGGGLNYHHFKMKQINQSWKWVDIYIYATGEDLSTTMSKSASLMMQKAGFFSRLMGSENDGQKLLNIVQLTRQQQFSQAITVYNSLSSKAKKIKIALLMRAQAAFQVSEQQYAQAIGDYLKYHPHDVSSNLMGIDFYFLKKQYPKALACVDNVDKTINDPYLNVFRGNFYVEMGENQKAKTAFANVIEKEPRNQNAYFSLLGLALKTKEHTEVTRILIQMERDLGMQWKDLRTVPEYADYVASPEYNNFVNRNK